MFLPLTVILKKNWLLLNTCRKSHLNISELCQHEELWLRWQLNLRDASLFVMVLIITQICTTKTFTSKKTQCFESGPVLKRLNSKFWIHKKRKCIFMHLLHIMQYLNSLYIDWAFIGRPPIVSNGGRIFYFISEE